MKCSLLQKARSDKDLFQKYPKHYHENKHYQSIKQKIMTNEDQPEVIRILSTEGDFIYNTKSFRNKTPQKVYKDKNKKYQSVPIRTICYNIPQNHPHKLQFTKTVKHPADSQSPNKFNSKTLFTNMKKLKDLRKSHYKNKILSEGTVAKQNQKVSQAQMKLDLFKITSTNFKYSDRILQDYSQQVDILRKLSQTKGTKRNIIKFKNDGLKSSNFYNILNEQSYDGQEKFDTIQNFSCLEPAKTQNQQIKQKHSYKMDKLSFESISLAKPIDKVVSQKNPKEQNKKEEINFVKYSSASIATDDQNFKRGLRKLNLAEFNPEDKHIEHMGSPFKASFRIKHVEDNRNILLTTIKKKARSLSKDQLFQFIKKVIT